MYKAGDNVSYSTTGICEIAEIKKMGAAGKEKEYYVLKPIYQKSATVYVPLNNSLLIEKMRPIINKTEADEIILKLKNDPLGWINDDGKRNVAFKEILHSGDLYQMLRLVACIYLQGEELSSNKHKLKTADSIIFANAEAYVYNELAFVLKINSNEVIEYIKGKLAE